MKPFAATVRNLTDSERRLLRHDRDRLKRQQEAQRKRGLIIFLTTWSVLAALTIIGAPAQRWIVIGFWMITGLAICLPSRAIERRRNARKLLAYDLALSAGTCREYTFDVRRYWEIEERDDEGPVYGFELRAGLVVFLMGQEYCANSRFPCSLFSLVEVRGQKDEVLLSEMRNTGVKIAPERVFPSSAWKDLRVVTPLASIDGPLEKAFEEIHAG